MPGEVPVDVASRVLLVFGVIATLLIVGLVVLVAISTSRIMARLQSDVPPRSRRRRLDRTTVIVGAIAVVGAFMVLLAPVRLDAIDWGAVTGLAVPLQIATTMVAVLTGALASWRLRPTPYDPAAAGEEAEEGEAPAPAELPELSAETAKAIVDLAAKSYADEFEQAKALDTKTAALMALTGAALLFVAGTAAKPPDGLTEPQKGAFVLLATLILGVFVLALFLLFLAFRTRTYQEIDLSQWARYSVMTRPVAEVCAEMASTYEDHVERNHNVNAEKAQRQLLGLWLLGLGVLLVLLLLVWLPLRWLPW